MRPRGRLVCFTGIDGGGKTTLSNHLVDALKQMQISHKYVYARFLPKLVTPIWTLGRWIFLRGEDMKGDYQGYNIKKKTALKSGLLARLHENLVLVDYFFQLLFKVTIPSLLGKNLVCDRYVFDTVLTDLAPDLDYSNGEAEKLIRLCFKFAPEPDLIFMIDVPEEITMKRKNDVASEQYLVDRRKYYRVLEQLTNLHKLDGTLPLEKLKKEVVDVYMQKFNEAGLG